MRKDLLQSGAKGVKRKKEKKKKLHSTVAELGSAENKNPNELGISSAPASSRRTSVMRSVLQTGSLYAL